MKAKILLTASALTLATALGLYLTLRPHADAEASPLPASAAPEPTSAAVSPLAKDASAGRQLVTTYCIACHANKDTQTEQQTALAPPLWAVRTRYLKQYPERAAFVEAMVSYILKPDAAKSHMPGAIDKFGIMTPLPFPPELLKDAATAIFEAEGVSAPTWWADHQQSGRGPRQQKSGE
ncbi:MAG: hypothetical protein RL376_1390 [Verrucomicrobiota bacterium]|jgi:mono/diheme cytochrome c family protein